MRSIVKRLMLATAIGSIVLAAALAGDMEPPGPPAPTMVTLQEIYDLIQSHGSTGGARVAKTGQTSCWDASGTPIACAGTGQDGEYQAGISVCPRFTDKGDGTVKDNLTGLIWLKNAGCMGYSTWTDALSGAAGLASGSCDLTDGSAAGDWRLPNVKELQSLIDFGQVSPALPPGHPFSGVHSDHYWSSTTGVNGQNYAWSVTLFSGGVSVSDKSIPHAVWLVRGGL